MISLSICVCGVLALSTTLCASSTVLTLGNGSHDNPSPTYGGDYVPPYPGTFEVNGNPLDQWITAVFCLDQNRTDYWQTSYTGVLEPLSSLSGDPSFQSMEEAAFLASLLLSDARQEHITISISGAGTSAILNQTDHGPMPMADFLNDIEIPISLAIWEIMGTATSTSHDPFVLGFETQANNEWTNLLHDPSNAYTQWLDSATFVFIPNGRDIDTQRFITVVVPEPGTLVLLGSGALLLALGCTRRLARRPR